MFFPIVPVAANASVAARGTDGYHWTVPCASSGGRQWGKGDVEVMS
jgi:hypothetical protein